MAVRRTAVAVTAPSSRSTPAACASALADALPLAREELTETDPPSSWTPFGVLDGALRLAASSPFAFSAATVPSVPVTTAARARAEAADCADAAATSGTTASTTSAERTRRRTRRVCQGHGRVSAAWPVAVVALLALVALPVAARADPIGATFTFTPTTPLTGQKVTFTGTPTADSEAIASWSWTVDGDFAGSKPTMTWTFATPGKHLVVLQVEDDDSDQATATAQVDVGQAPSREARAGDLVAQVFSGPRAPSSCACPAGLVRSRSTSASGRWSRSRCG